MFQHLILGLLRDGRQRHGYELATLYRGRSGSHVSPGNFYRELARTRRLGWVQPVVNPPDTDARRIPYCITERGRRAFDAWLLTPFQGDHTLTDWILFVDRVPAEARERIVERHREALRLRSKALARARENALAAAPSGYDPLPALLMRKLKRVSADLEFLAEFRDVLAAWDHRAVAPVAAPADGATPGARTRKTAR